jgi:hypothetical protein
MGDGLKISRETFEGYPVSSKLDTLFDLAKASHEQLCLTHDKCDKRFEKLEHRRWFDKTLAFGGGILGGVATVLGIKVGQ